jgi:Fe-S-cluster-containing dehydrogenase component
LKLKNPAPEKRIGLVVDLDRCWGCKACEVACKQELGIGAGTARPLLVVEIGPRNLAGALQRDFVPVMCQHCRQPACMEACPAEAIYRASDGTVQINPDLCDRCGLCESACPFGVISLTEQHGPIKCTFCMARREDGWLPSCAQHCEGRAFTVADEREIVAVVKRKKYAWSTGQVTYVSDKWADLGKAFPEEPR